MKVKDLENILKKYEDKDTEVFVELKISKSIEAWEDDINDPNSYYLFDIECARRHKSEDGDAFVALMTEI